MDNNIEKDIRTDENLLLSGIDLLRHLCLTDGPTGFEEPVADEVCRQLDGCRATVSRDRTGNVYAILPGGGSGYDPALPHRVMLSAHTDEVGFIINDIDGEGYLKFACLGGIDSRVLCGKRVTVHGDNGTAPGVIASKAIHLQSADERKTATKVESMYIDIGAHSRDEAEKLVRIGDCATFDSDFVLFGENDGYIKCKAVDDRLGCAVIIETLRRLDRESVTLPFDLICAFTVREEIGKSGAKVAAQRFRPDCAIVLESTAIADLPDVAKNSRVSEVGAGGVISLVDRSTIYDRGLVDSALDVSARHGIPAQIKKYVSGGNDAGHIHISGSGVRALAVSAPTRYLHSPSCVCAVRDFQAIKDLIFALLTDGNV